MKISAERSSYYCPKTIAFLAIMLLMALPVSVFAQLSGTYTIGAGGDYATFSAAATALHDQGVAGPVTFDVLDGTYTEQVEINSIPGASETNTVTFRSQSGDSTKVIVQYLAAGDADNYVFKLNLCDYVTLRGITIRALDTRYCRLLYFSFNTKGVTIENCVLRGTRNTNALRRAAHIDGENVWMRKITIRNNHFRRGSYGIFYNGINGSMTDAEITGNQFDSLGYTAISIIKGSNTNISYNRIAYSSYGLRLLSTINSYIGHNHLSRIDHKGIYVSNMGVSTGRESVIVNNHVAMMEHGAAGMEIRQANHLKIYHNTVLLHNTQLVDAKALWLYHCTLSTLELVNNNLVCLSKGKAIYVNGDPSYLKECDYNNYYTPDRVFAYWNDHGNCEDFRTFVEVSKDNEHSVFAWPWFVSDDDLHARSAWLDGKGKPLADVTDDLNGNPRDGTHPDIGCYEFTAPPEAGPPLSGVKTIGSGGTYPTLQDAVEDARIKGISGTLKWHFLKGTHEVHSSITPVAGASSKQPIIMEPATGKAEDVTLQYDAAGGDDNYLLKLHGISFLKIKNLTFESKDNRFASIFLLEGMVDSLVVDSCTFITPQQFDANPSACVVWADKANFHDMAFRGNTFIKGSRVIFFNLQNFNSKPGALRITGNDFTGDGYEAVYLYRVRSVTLSGNRISGKTYGISLGYTNDHLIINKNKIQTGYGMGIRLNNCKLPFYEVGRVYNNFLACTGNYPNRNVMDIRGCQNIQIHFNSVSGHSNTYKSRPLYLSNSSDLSLKNNIFSNQGSQYAIYVMGLSTTPFDYNCLYTEGANLAYWGQDCADMDALRSVSGLNEHSIVADPQFLSDADLHVTSPALDSAATPISWITTDIDGDQRNAQYPDIGADEFVNMPHNDPPVAENDTGSVYQAGILVINPLLNDSDPDSDEIVLSRIDQPAYGTCEIDTSDMQEPWLIYKAPKSDFTGLDSVQYFINDSYGGIDSAWLVVTVKKIKGFTPVDVEGLPEVDGGGLWCDFDRDGDLDVLLGGHFPDYDTLGETTYSTRMFSNDGGKLNPGQVLAPFGMSNSESFAWGDFNLDGSPDLVLTGYSSEESATITKLFTSENAVFNEVGTDIMGASLASVDWGDYDLDGDPDLIISGSANIFNMNYRALIYRNDGPGIEMGKWKFTDTHTLKYRTRSGSSRWGDYDKDGDPDLLMTGFTSSFVDDMNVSVIFNNDQGEFNEIDAGFDVGDYAGHSLWCDVDNDGDLDVVIAGNDKNDDEVIVVYENKEVSGSRIFEKKGAVLEGIQKMYGSVDCGDYDNDGDIDLLITGLDSAYLPITMILNNDGKGVFSDAGINLPGVQGMARWGDYNDDGSLDILLVGVYADRIIGPRNEPLFGGIFLNNNKKPNTPPQAPAGLRADMIDSTTVILSWNPASDSETPAPGLTYNVRVGTAPGKSDVMSAMADPATGKLFVPQMGNVGADTFCIIKGLEKAKQYYWSVQAVDQGYMASAFAQEQNFKAVLSFDIAFEFYDDQSNPVEKGRLVVSHRNDEGLGDFGLGVDVTGTNEKVVTNFPAGQVTASFRPDRNDYPDLIKTYIGGTPFGRDATWFELKRDTSGVAINLLRGHDVSGTSRVSGTLVQSDGKALKGYWVFLIDNEGKIVKFDVTNDNGEFAFNDVPKGTYAFDGDILSLPVDPDNDSIRITADNKLITLSAKITNKITVEITGVTGVEDLNNTGIVLYPNPVEDRLMIRSGKNFDEGVQIIVRDIQGRVVRSVRLPYLLNDTAMEVPLGDLRNGLYEVAIMGRRCYYRGKVLKVSR